MVSLGYKGDMKGAVKGATEDYGCIPFPYIYADIINNLIQVMVKQITLISCKEFQMQQLWANSIFLQLKR